MNDEPGLLRRPSTWTGILAALLQLATLPYYAASGLLAPGWAVVGLLVLWALLTAALVVVVRRRSPFALLIPLGAVALWFLLLTLGEQLLGWTG